MPQLAVIGKAALTADESGATPLVDGTSQIVALTKVVRLGALAMVRVWFEVGVGVVAVRPWYKRDGKWWPMRFDGATLSAGAAPLTADATKMLGRADGFFVAAGISHPVALVDETNDGEGVNEAFIEPCEMLP